MPYSLFSFTSLNGEGPKVLKPSTASAVLPEINAGSIKELAAPLESHGALFWDDALSFKSNIIRLLKAYSEAWSLSRHHRSEIRALISLVEKESVDDPKAKIQMLTELTYSQILTKGGKAEGEALRTLSYILIHCSGLYTGDIRKELIREHTAASNAETTGTYEHFASLH